VEHALDPSVRAAGLPPGIVRLIDSPTHASAHALFNDQRLALAVARGSGPVVAELGAVAAQAGTPVSLHGTGGAWMVVAEDAAPATVTAAVRHSLDRKVCNTLNVCAVVRSGADTLVPAFLAGLDAAAAERGTLARLHVVDGGEAVVPVGVDCSTVTEGDLAREWEWEDAPEVTLVIVESVDEAVSLSNRYSPHFVASLISEDPDEHRRFYAGVDAPFVGTGFTRWVDGQYALGAPELGLSNWQRGRTLGRGAILSGDSVFTVRYRAEIDDHHVRR
jgi:glutamate-5-semialdehyde dehydrogenase